MVGADRGDEGATLTSQIALKGAAMEATVTEAGTILEELYTTVARAFVLDANNEWIPVATGAVVGEKSEDKNILTVSLNEETNPDVVLFSTTFHQSNQERVIRQQATVVTWTTADQSDVALSFEDEEGCSDFWAYLCAFLGRSVESNNNENMEEGEMEDNNAGLGDAEADVGGRPNIFANSMERVVRAMCEVTAEYGPSSPAISLPSEVEVVTLEAIDEALRRVTTTPMGDIKRQLSNAIIEKSYLSRLIELFRQQEQSQDIPALEHIFSIFRSLLILGNATILKELLSSSNILSVAGIFEYDPAAVIDDKKPEFREFLLNESRFKRIVDFENSELLDMIHHCANMQFMKDVVLPKYLDEESFGSIVFMVRCIFAEIIDKLEQDSSFISQLVASFKIPVAESRLMILKLLKEYLGLAKISSTGRPLSIFQREFFPELVEFLRKILIEPLGDTIADEMKFLVSEIVLAICQQDLNIVRSHTLERRSLPIEDHFLSAIIDKLNQPSCPVGLRWQLVASLRMLLDNSSALSGILSIGNDEFLNFFYPDMALRLLNPLIDQTQVSGRTWSIIGPGVAQNPANLGRVKLDRTSIDLLYNSCELLTSFILQHKYRIKYLLFKSFIIHNALSLLRCSDKPLRLCAIRVVRSMIGTGDDFYFRFLIKQSLFKPIIDESINLGDVNNAISSAIIDLFCFIRERRFKLIINHLVESYSADLGRITFYPIGDMLIKAYEDVLGISSSGSSSASVGKSSANIRSAEPLQQQQDQPHDRWSRVDESEESYFSNIEEDGALEEDRRKNQDNTDDYNDDIILEEERKTRIIEETNGIENEDIFFSSSDSSLPAASPVPGDLPHSSSPPSVVVTEDVVKIEGDDGTKRPRY